MQQIRIIAISKFMSIDEVISEKKVERRLKQIRDNWKSNKHKRPYDDKLSVRTYVHNPTLF